MSSGQMPGAEGHFVGGAMNGADGLFFFGWARDGGDLRVSHFLATHAMHAVPVAAWAGARIGLVSIGWARLAALVWTVLVVATFAQAAMGLPFIPV